MRGFFQFLWNMSLAGGLILLLIALQGGERARRIPFLAKFLPPEVRVSKPPPPAPSSAGAPPAPALPPRPAPAAPAPAPVKRRGGESISGMVAYPGEGGAETGSLKVCARDLDNGRVRCAERLNYGSDGGVSYRIATGPGSFLVYASQAYAAGAKRAYFTEYADCFIKKTGCRSDSREAISVVLGDGESASGIDPVDWGGRP